MLSFLVLCGYPVDYLYWSIGILEFQYIFLNSLKLRVREMQQSALTLIGAVGTFFVKDKQGKKQETYHEILNTVGAEIDKVTCNYITPLSLILTDIGIEKPVVFEEAFSDWRQMFKHSKGLPPGGIPK